MNTVTSKLLRRLFLATLFAFVGSSIASAGQIFWVDWQDTVVEGGVTKYRGKITVTRPDSTISVVTVKFTPPGSGIAFYQPSGGTDYWTNGFFGTTRNPATSPYTSNVVDNIPTGTDIIGLQFAGQNTLEFTDAGGAPLQIGNPVFAYVSLNGNGYGFDKDFDILSYGDPATGNDIGFWGTGTSYKSVVGAQYQLLGTGEPHGALQFKGAFSTVTWQSLSNENWNGFTIGVPGLAADIPIANAGPDQTVNAGPNCQGTVQLSGSVTGSTNAPFTYKWTGPFGTLFGQTVNVNLPVGQATITLEVTDSKGAKGVDSVVVTVKDVAPPIVNCTPLAPITAGANCAAVIPNIAGSVIASDNCAAPNQLTRTQSPAAGTTVGIGNHVITVTVTDPSGNTAACQSVLSVVAGASFSYAVPDVYPDTPFLSCIIGNFQEPTRIQNWKLRWSGSGTANVVLTVAATTVNTMETGAIEATVTDQTGLKTVTVVHPGTQTDNIGSLSLTLQGGNIYDLAIRRTGQAAHYKLGSPDKRLEIGFAYPLLYLEHHEQAIAFNAAPNENVNISVLRDDPPIGGAGPQATTMTYSIRRADCSVVVPSTTIPVSGTIAFPAGAGGSFVLYLESMDGHFALRRNSGCDGGFYLLPCPPHLQLTCPANIVVRNDPGLCGATVSFAATATGVCSPTVTYTQAPGTYFPVGTTMVTATATDIFGESESCSFTVTVLDTEPPQIVAPAQNKQLECDGPTTFTKLNNWLANNGGAVATDNCGRVTWSNNFTGLSGGCGATGSATVTFTATDLTGRSSSTTATFTVVDTKAPTILTPAANLKIECDGSDYTRALTNWLASNGGATASDACGSVTWSHDFRELSKLCGATGSATVTFTATDECGNQSTTTATFTIADTKAPTILAFAANQTVECDGSGNMAALNRWLASNGGATATDACGSVTWSHNFRALSDLCGATGSATVTFTATDECGNSTFTTATFTIIDTTAPTILTPAVNLKVECDGGDYTAALNRWLASNGGATASDTCGAVTWSNDFSGLSDLCGATGSATVTFTATDECGNKSTTTATFAVVDTKAPTILTPAANQTVECDGSGNTAALNRWLASNGGATASDACGAVTWSHDFRALSDLCGATGSATVTFVATDECGNSSSTTATFTIIDTTAPTLTSNVRDILPKEAPITFTLSGQDLCGNVTVTVTRVTAHAINSAGKVVDKAGSTAWQIAGNKVTIVNSGGVGTIFTIYGTAVDDCGNTTPGTFIVNVLRPANEGVGNGVDGNTPGHDNNGGNDDPAFTPGNPGAKNKK